MKKLVFITCLLFVILGTTAQTIHWITFVDTTDRRVGKLDVNGHEVLYNNFINDVNAALAEKGYESDIQDFVGEKFTLEFADAKRIIGTNAAWLIDYWCGKDFRRLVQMLFSRHWIMHIEAALRIAGKLRK